MNKQYFIDKLTKTQIDNFKNYNYDLLSETFNHLDKLPIECYQHGIFYQEASSHLFGRGCPECGKYQVGTGRTLTTNMFINKSKYKFNDKFDYAKTNYIKKDIDLILTCNFHGDFLIRPSAHMWSRHGCPKCDFEIPREISKIKYLEKASKIHNNKYDYSKVTFISVNKPVEIICPNHGIFKQPFRAHIDCETGCPKCALESNKFTLEQFIDKSKVVHGDDYEYSKVNYETNASMVIITCKKHGDFIQRAASHLSGSKCKKCFSEDSRKSTEEFIRNAKLNHGDKYDYSRVNYLGNKTHIEIICPKHGSFWQKPNNHLSNNNGCRFCSESKGEILVEIFLKKYKINYIREYKVLPYLYRYDFFLPDLNIFIEFNGYQHYSPIDFFGGEIGFHKTKERDIIKKQIVRDNKANLVIVTYVHLNSNSVERELIRQLKRINKFWFVIDNSIKVFKLEKDLYKPFGLSPRILLRDAFSEVKKIFKNLRVLF